MPPRRPQFVPRPVLERWNAKVEPAETGCWLWTGAISREGYGRIAGPRKQPPSGLYAHRVAFELFIGPIPKGLHLDHLCRVRECVNPTHLEPVTVRENAVRGVGWTGQRARSTHCVHGHAFTPENTRMGGPNHQWRYCRACARRTATAYYRARHPKAA